MRAGHLIDGCQCSGIEVIVLEDLKRRARSCRISALCCIRNKLVDASKQSLVPFLLKLRLVTDGGSMQEGCWDRKVVGTSVSLPAVRIEAFPMSPSQRGREGEEITGRRRLSVCWR